MNRILNIGAGKQKPINLKVMSPYFLLNLDKTYFNSVSPECFEDNVMKWTGGYDDEMNLNWDIDEFLDRTTADFDHIVIYRYLEHVPMINVLYFIYLLSTVTKSGAMVDVIVPNYRVLATRLLEENPSDPHFEADNILTTTEMLNEPDDPHASIWTLERAKHFWELEQRFIVTESQEDFVFDGRDIYLRFFAKRI